MSISRVPAIVLSIIRSVVPIAIIMLSQQAIADVQSLAVEGNKRVDAETIRSYLRLPSGQIDQAALDDGLKSLIETGLFQDVKINRIGTRIVVSVIENRVIGRVAFEGNKKVKDEQLSAEIQSKPRGSLSRPIVQSDAQRISEIYRRSGRYDVQVVPEIIEQPNNRADLIFTINEGVKTAVRSIEFVGNHFYSSYRLKDVIKTRESNFLSFLTSGDIYDPDRVETDRDLLRRYYLKNGFADVQVVAALTEYDPEQKGFFVTFKIEEGYQYRVAAIDFSSTIPNFDPNTLRNFSLVGIGSLYNVEALEKSVEEMQIEMSRRGYAFAAIRPRGDRNQDRRTVAISFTIEEGPRMYIERINVRGNTRTHDYVVRREFDLAEGDAYNRALVDRAERRLKNLDFFKSVKITTEAGSSNDRVILVVDLEEKSTGDFSISGGYSTTDGALAEVSVSERNFLGRGLYAKASVQYGQYTRGYSLSFVEPYLLDYRIALGLDFYQKKQMANSYVSYNTSSLGFSPRLGFQLREDLALQLRYSIYQQAISLTSAYNNCNNLGSTSTFTPGNLNATQGMGFVNASDSNTWGCYADGESALPVRKELSQGSTVTSMLGYTLTYNTLDNTKNPTDGLLVELKQDYAGVGGDVSYLKSSGDAKYYSSLVADIIGVLHVQGGLLTNVGQDIRMLDHFQMGPNLVRGFAQNGIGPRDISYVALGASGDALGGTKYWGASYELQMPFWFLPKEVGLKGAVYADAGSLWGYQGPTSWAQTGEVNAAGCVRASKTSVGNCAGMTYDDDSVIRSSVGVGLIWQSPFGPLRFDYAVPITKGQYDRVQQFRFGGGTSF